MSTPPSASTKKTRRSRTICWVIGVAVVVPVAVAYVYFAGSGVSNAEQDALDYIRLNGYTSEGYEHTRVSDYWLRISNWFDAFLPSSGASAPAPRSRPLGVRVLTGVGFPRGRMTDEMARQLVNISNLHQVTLYPPDPNGSGCDFEATVMKKVRSLGQLRLPLSSASIAMLKAQFPDIEIYVAERPPAETASKTDLDGNE